MSWLFWCTLIAITVELVIQFCIIRAAYPLLFAPMPDRFNLAGTLTTLPENDESIKIEAVSFPTSNGLTLRGFLATPENCDPHRLILFCHPFKSTGKIALFQCRGLLDAGFAVFTFDFRNHGESDTDPHYDSIHWLSNHEISDVEAAIRYIRQQPQLNQLPLGLFGMSRGAGAALAVAAQSPEIQFVACEGAFLNEELFLDHAIRWGERFLPRLFIQLVPTSEVIRAFRLMIWYSQRRQGCRYINLKSYLRSLKTRELLFLVGENDRSVVPRMTELIVQKIQSSNARVCLLPKAIHNAGRFTQPDQFDAALIDFFSQMPLKLSQQTESEFRSDPVSPFRKRSA
ncbi:esterase [Gimesia alba]|uniref:Esterase n=1 Tax=Gimesia alba TaxID=2527973 RepID=A0A517RN94_9PLAN|nr:alpha/beta fold hydrolase [Gimesia alba]QDT45339.1 esterase [Gimesia alba]